MKKRIFIIIAILMLVSTVTACSVKERSTVVQNTNEINQNTVQAVQNESSTDEQSTAPTTAEKEITSAQTTDEQKSESQSETSKAQTTTKKSDNKTTSSQNTTTTTGHTTTKKQTTTKKAETATKKQTTTQKQTTTKKATTTKKTATTTTTKKQGLSKADVEWVQSQAHAYIKSKGLTVDSSLGSFSGRISTIHYTDKSKLLAKVKEAIDVEYQECIDAGWKQVNMYVKITPDGNDYWVYVMYG